MTEHKSKWMKSMVAKHGSEEAVKQFMREAQKKSRVNYKGTGGFGSDREKAREAANKRWGNIHTDNPSAEA